MRRVRIAALAVVLLLVWRQAYASAYSRVDFLQEHCIKCHGPDKQKADRRFDHLSETARSTDELELWQEILDMLNLGDMPPEDEPQPSAAERAKMVASTTGFLTESLSHMSDSGGHSVLRRLNAWEYRHTIGDLLGLNVSVWNPAEAFPAEVEVDGFDNIGAELVTSGMLLDKYFLAAEEAIGRATQFGNKPKPRRWVQKSPFYFDGKENADLPKLFRVDRFRFIPETPYTDLYGRHYRGGHIGFEPLSRGGVSQNGMYTVRVKAAAVDRYHPYGNALDDFQNGDPLVLELVAVDREGSVESTGSISKERSLARVELTDEKPQWFEWNVFIEEGFEPEVRFANGTIATKRLVRIITQKAGQHPEVAPFADMKAGNEKSHGLLKVYRGPKLRIWEIQVEGPHLDKWPSPGHLLLYGELNPDQLNPETIVRRLRSFATAAFRRPLQDDELDPIESLVTKKLKEGLEPLEALQLGFQTILCAPAFLYLSEGEGPLNDYTLASRLSYFLWSSMPDEQLLAEAEAGRLLHPEVLRRQIDRMLRDSKSDRFVSNFIRRWLEVDNIGEMPVSEEFRTYHRDNIEKAMMAETETFFRHVLDNNLSPGEFLSADYSFLNRELARHYGLEGMEGHELRRVSLAGTRRRGLTGHALVQVASANGVDTSPVVRGIYVLENLLGRSPPPPPPDVPLIESDVSEAKTIRELLAKHREVPTCTECHRKIDPLGFALENFDAAGLWRTRYGNRGRKIDASGILPSGEPFSEVSEFQELLSRRSDDFTRCLIEKMMTYSLGRTLGLGDRAAIDKIQRDLLAGQGGLQDLIAGVVLSNSFLNN